MISSAIAVGSLALPRTASAATLKGQHRTLPGNRTYWLYGSGTALVVGLHISSHGADHCNSTFWTSPGGWQDHAMSKGYVLALGEAPGTWNVGGLDLRYQWQSSPPRDDMGYLLNLVADAKAQNPSIDRVYIAGASAGGAMAWKAGVEHPEVFSAVGSASGWATVYPTSSPIRCWHSHGTADTTVPVRGGMGADSYLFPEAALEAELAPYGSKVVLYPFAGGHSTPGWMADRLWNFWKRP